MIVFACTGCGQTFEVDDARAGRKAWCDRCGRMTRVPAEEAGPVIEIEPGTALVPVDSGPQRPDVVTIHSNHQDNPAHREWGGIEREGWLALGIGLGLAGAAMAAPPIAFALDTLKTIIHESGHTATAWLLASPAFPQFDLTYGGGHSHVYGRQPILVVAAYLALGYFLLRAWGDRPAVIGWAVAAAGYTGVMFTPLRELSITAMGHGAELIVAGIFLFRAVSGSRILRSTERPLYAAVGFFLVLADARFAAGLMTDSTARAAYGDAKGGGHWMDFDRVATTLGWPIERVAGAFLLACILTPVAAYVAHRLVLNRRWAVRPGKVCGRSQLLGCRKRCSVVRRRRAREGRRNHARGRVRNDRGVEE